MDIDTYLAPRLAHESVRLCALAALRP
jgi:hypothetical protein